LIVIEAGHAADDKRREAGVVVRRDVERRHRSTCVDAERPRPVSTPSSAGFLPHQTVAGASMSKLGRESAPSTLWCRRRRPTVPAGVSAGSSTPRSPVVGVDAEVLLGVADEAEAIVHRIEVDAEARAARAA
jgi:hypothetical protein